MLQLTKITTTQPRILSKSLELANGALKKIKGGTLVNGTAERLKLANITELAELLTTLDPTNALIYGICNYDRARVVTKKALANIKENGGDPTIARTRDHFKFPENAGVMMLDGDFPKNQEPMNEKKYLRSLYEVCPAIENAPHILVPSASTYLYKGDKCLKGPDGWRILVAVQSAKDIPRAGEVFFKRCWLYGHGYIFISKSGHMLPRTIIDASVWQPERLDFTGGAHCIKPLEQRRPAPEVFNPVGEPLNTTVELPGLSHADEDRVLRAIDLAKQEARPESEAIQIQWVNERVTEALQGIGTEEHEAERQRLIDVYTRATKNKILYGDFVLTLADEKQVTVGDMLDHPDIYHGKRCADPLEPDYNNDHRIGWINLRAAGRSFIHSHAHGGQRYNLHRARKTVQLIAGERFCTVRKVLELMRINGEHYQRSEIVRISQEGEVIPRDKEGLLYDLDGLARFERFDKRADKWLPCDCKPNIAAGVMAARGSWGLPKLTGISTAPILDPVSRRVIDDDGYDSQTGLMLILNDLSSWHGIPDEPDRISVENAVKRLWTPFKDFPFDGPVSRGVWLNAILTAVVRPLLPTAPGIGATAPIAGSGKTLLAKSLAEITGDIPALLPDAGDAEEIRKRLLALLRQNKRILILDNVVGILDSSALCAMLTAETFQDRVLGVSETISVPTRTLLLITGNNITLRGDLCRRVLTCRIDPEMETPWKRAFDLDPVEYCREHRIEIVRDAITILRAGLQNGPKTEDRTASFEIWSDSCRRAVCIVAEYGLLDVQDPVDSIDTAYEMDPETAKLAGLMIAWWDIYQGKPVKVATMIGDALEMGFENRAYPELYAAGTEIAGEGRFNINARRLGRWIERNQGRIVNRTRICHAGSSGGVRQWSLKSQF